MPVIHADSRPMDTNTSCIFRFGDFELDPAKRQLSTHDGQVVPLQPKVFNTLLYLVRNPARTLGKDELIRSVWGHAFVEDNNLNQHISVLRRVLGDRGHEPRYIATLPRCGYCFVADVITADRKPDGGGHPPIGSLAILAFRALTSTQRNEVLELGMADALIMRMSALPDLLVRPLASVRRYAALDVDALRAGRELGVDAVLDGSIESADGHIRIRARLLLVASGQQLWADHFDEPYTDLFGVQDAISERVAEAISAHLNAAMRSALARNPTISLEAYELYLRGIYHCGKVTPDGLEHGADFLTRAVQVDPDFALAHVGLANLWRTLVIARDAPPHRMFPAAKLAAQEALRIDPGCADAHAALGFITFWYDWDWPAAERAMRTAIALDARCAEAHLAFAHLLSHLARHDEALEQIGLAHRLDPLSLRINALEGMFLFYARQYAEAAARLHDALELEPEFWVSNLTQAKVQIAQGDFDGAARSLEIAGRASGGNSEVASLQCYALARAGRDELAQAILDELERKAANHYVPPYNFAIACIGLDWVDEAFAWLELAHEDRDVRLTSIKVEPKWDQVRADPRFVALLGRMRLD